MGEASAVSASDDLRVQVIWCVVAKDRPQVILDHIIVINERHLQAALAEFADYHNRELALSLDRWARVRQGLPTWAGAIAINRYSFALEEVAGPGRESAQKESPLKGPQRSVMPVDNTTNRLYRQTMGGIRCAQTGGGYKCADA